MKYEYVTTIVYLNDSKATMVKVNPPDDTGWSLLSMVTSPNGLALYYNWAKQKKLTEIVSSDSAFENSLNIIQAINQVEAINKITDAVKQLDNLNKKERDSEGDL